MWEELSRRAVEIQVADHLRARLEGGDQLRVKFGMDPTAPDLHLGHLVVLDVLADLQDAGHTVVIIVGDFTAMIGDPSGRSRTRPMLSREEVDANATTYFQQIAKVLDPGLTEVHGNSEWLLGMNGAEVLRLLGRASLQQVMQREDFASRWREGSSIGAHEILYPFNQAYDSVAVRADLEVGGSDQLFNLLFGREIQRAYGQEPQDVAVFPLLEGPDGVKMSKSAGNHIGISEPPAEIYGKLMSIPDPLTARYLSLVARLGPERQAEVLAMPPRDTKAALARRMVERLHGAEAGRAAEEDFRRRFVERGVPDQVPEHRASGAADLAGTIVESGLARSRSEARRLIAQDGVRVNQGKVREETFAGFSDGDLLQVGRRRFVRVRTGPQE